MSRKDSFTVQLLLKSDANLRWDRKYAFDVTDALREHKASDLCEFDDEIRCTGMTLVLQMETAWGAQTVRHMPWNLIIDEAVAQDGPQFFSRVLGGFTGRHRYI